MAMRPRTLGGANNSTANRQRGAVVRPVYEDFKPKSEWIQNQESDNLLIYLPGFTKQSLKVSTEGRNIIKVRGEHLVTGNRWQRLQEDFHAPDYCNIRGIRARFEGGILTITVPKNTITPPPKEVSKPIDKPTTSQKPSEILPAKPPQIPKDPLTQNVQETIPPKITALKEEDEEKHVQEFIVPPKPISPLPSKVPKEPLSQKVQETIPPKITALKEEDKEKHVQESIVPPKPISHLPSKVPKEPLSQKVQENVPPKINAPNNNDKAKAFQESPVSSNPISSVADDKRKYDQTFSKQEKLPKKSDAEQKQKVDSGASKQQETMNETKAQHGDVEMEKNKRIHDLMDAGEAAKRRKIMEEENNALKPEFVEKNIQETERNKAHKTAFVDEKKAKYPNKSVTSSGTGHFGVGNLKKAVNSLAELDEERKLLVNMGAAVIVFMALGAYIYHNVKN